MCLFVCECVYMGEILSWGPVNCLNLLLHCVFRGGRAGDVQRVPRPVNHAASNECPGPGVILMTMTMTMGNANWFHRFTSIPQKWKVS